LTLDGISSTPIIEPGWKAKRFCFSAELPTLAEWGVAFVFVLRS